MFLTPRPLNQTAHKEVKAQCTISKENYQRPPLSHVKPTYQIIATKKIRILKPRVSVRSRAG